MKYLSLLLLFFVLTGCCINNCCSLPTADITEMYAQYIDEWKSQAEKAFSDAEAKIFVVKPKPDVVIGPDEDPAKCVCKGTGVIVHGDGHKTPCPFHSKTSSKMKSILESKSLIIQH